MKSFKTKDNDLSIKKNIFYGILFISLLGCLLHSVYNLSGKLIIIGLIAPINESIWEHLKLAFFPTIIWWVSSYFVLKRKTQIAWKRWFASAVISSVISPLFIITFYITYTGAFGFNSIILDISSLLIGVLLAQIVARHVYRYAKIGSLHYYLAIFVLFVFLLAFTFFTFIPPKLPLFLDSTTGKYGLQ